LGAFLKRAASMVDKDEPWGNIASAARQDPSVAVARALGAWVAEDLLSAGKPAGAAQVPELRHRASQVERMVGEVASGLANLSDARAASPTSMEAAENLREILTGEMDALSEAASLGFLKAAGAPVFPLRRGLTLEDLIPEGPRGERVRFSRPVAPPPGLALEPIAHLRQDLARLKHYGLRDAVGRSFRPMPVGVSSSYFKVIRPPVSLEGDLGEFRDLSGLANGADAWADEVRAALLHGFEERLRARGSTAALGPAGDWPLVLRSLELERAVADLKGALEREVDSAAIPAEGLLALVIAAPLPEGGLTP
jgi:hypothetical protein